MGFCSLVDSMEVYTAARDGNLTTLRQLLDPHPKDEASKLIQCKSDGGATPLIIAAKNGHLSVVQWLVDKYDADIETVGSVTFDGENIDGAPPLWCAAAAGHQEVVKYLIKCGAKVNNTTYTNSTPLRAACFDGHKMIMKFLVENGADIEIANRHGHTCLMISCYKGHYGIVKYLISKGAEVNRKSLKGNTALHDCAESGSLEIMRLLLDNAAVMTKDSYGMTPLLAAAVTGHTEIVKYLVLQENCTRLERAEALELLGATYVDKKRNIAGAVKYWRLALTERYEDKNDILDKPSEQSPLSAYGNAKEISTVEELNDIAADPDTMRMQALLVRERVLGPAHPDTSYYIRYRGAVYADIGDFERCVLLWMYALDMQQKILDPLSPMTQSSFLSFAELFSFMMMDGRNRKAQTVSYENMMAIYKKAFTELDSGLKHLKSGLATSDKEMTSFNRLLTIILHLTSLLCRIQSSLTTEQEHHFKKMVYQLVKLNPRGLRRYTLLHLACSRNTTTVGRYPVCSFPSLDVIRLLLEVGSSVNAVDIEGNTSLHVAAFNVPCNTDIVKILLEYGAHHDACNFKRKTPFPLASSESSDVNSPLQYITLQCLSARCVVNNSIPYENRIPKKLHSFVKMH